MDNNQYYCFKCNNNPCICGNIYLSYEPSTLKQILCGVSLALKEKGVDVITTIDGKPITDSIIDKNINTLFDKNFLNELFKHFPYNWKSTIEKFKDILSIVNYLNTKNEDDFPLVGILLFIIHVMILKQKRKSSHDLFINVLKLLYDRETFLRDLIEFCSNNPKALILKLKVYLDDPNMDSVNKEIFRLVSKYLESELNYSNKKFNYNSIMYFVRILITYTSNKTVPENVDVRSFIDELYYVDQTIFDYMKKEKVPIDMLSLPLQ